MSFVVTIDGPAGAGKSTTARAVAARLGILYVDTGALYLAFALKVLERGIAADDLEQLEVCARQTALDLAGSPDRPHVWLDGVDVSDRIRTPEVSELSSRLAALPLVRQWLIGIQRDLRDRGPLVAEGRDLGTVVFPDAEVKIFLDANLETRAARRFDEHQRRGLEVRKDEVAEEVARRDARDRSRDQSPLTAAADAMVIDTTTMDLDGQIEAVLAAVRRHPASPAAPEIP